jgi:hypothetical protein
MCLFIDMPCVSIFKNCVYQVANRPSAVIAAECRCPAETKTHPISSVERIPLEAENNFIHFLKN